MATHFARDWRNKRIGHTDLLLALNQSAQPHQPASCAGVETAVKSLHDVLDYVHTSFTKSPLLDEPPAGEGRGKLTLMHVIRAGLGSEDARKGRIRSGTFTREDVQHEPL